jgi:hypothetical protein
VYESLSCPRCEKSDLKIIVTVGKSSHAEDAGKSKNVQELEDFSEEQQAVELLRTKKRTDEQLSQNIKTVADHPGNDTVLRFKGM